ncbi:2-oxoacid:acceptor oxidoreductase family protein [Desulforhopalus singaporensis]|uniref:2-oxoglutarate ferredoxin oxidoreductase subunit gamma n=1 Tax=Desulforhopalus singaporensis TaxID=91360 RepID=A0A1H0SBS1_9BACT|nr:2-oxoacid:acceptor oxidoreductase family protein [Desulforhopalus singaporensis]SDP39261.1 2-oxoglutarate ferredoxin oxidoreductase subunit gamma [Desulforhopalus singaporensis]
MLSVTCAGFGGQGVLTAGLLLANVSMVYGKKITWVPSYGSEMRGGTASCHLRIGDSEILNPFFSSIDTLIAMNEESVDSFQEKVVTGGVIIANSTLVKNKTFRDDIRVAEVAATAISAELDNPRGANIVMLGAAIGATGLFPVEDFADGIDAYFGKKGRNNPLNRECFMRGAQAALDL